MSCLDATFTLTPLSPLYNGPAGDLAALYCYGADFTAATPTDLSSAYASDRFYFSWGFASDSNVNYTQWNNRRRARLLEISIDLRSYAGTNKELALIFGFEVAYTSFLGSPVAGRVLVYSDAALLHDQKLIYGDNQFLMEIESLEQPLNLYFIHASGNWFFQGISGYVV